MSRRSGRAQLTHPVRQLADLLGGGNNPTRGPPTTLDAIQRSGGDRGRSRCVLPRVPHAGSASLHPPSPSQGPPGRVPLLLWYYEGVRLPVPLSPRLVAFAWRYHGLRLSFRCLRSRTPNRGPGVQHPVPIPEIMPMEAGRASQVPEESLCAYALLSDPGRTDSTGHTSVSARPPLCPRRRLPRRNSRGSMTRPWHSLSTLRGLGRPSAARKTRFPLLATLRGGIGYPQDSNERFQTKSSPFLELCLAQGHRLLFL
jgi:hypothetical protein